MEAHFLSLLQIFKNIRQPVIYNKTVILNTEAGDFLRGIPSLEEKNSSLRLEIPPCGATCLPAENHFIKINHFIKSITT